MKQWAVWGDGRKPLLEGSEDEVKQFVEGQVTRDDLYIQSEDGKEEIFEGGRWVPVS